MKLLSLKIINKMSCQRSVLLFLQLIMQEGNKLSLTLVSKMIHQQLLRLSQLIMHENNKEEVMEMTIKTQKREIMKTMTELLIVVQLINKTILKQVCRNIAGIQKQKL